MSIAKLIMKKYATKKHSVLFKPTRDVERPMFTAVYLMNSVYVELGSPNEIEVTVAARE